MRQPDRGPLNGMAVAYMFRMLGTLRDQIRELLRTGHLPRQRQIRMQTGPGLDLPCAACGHTIKPGELDFELEFDGPWETTIYRFHGQCQAIWEAERREAA